MAINDLMERDGLTEGEVREDFTDDEIFNHQMEMKDFDYEDYLPLDGLTAMEKPRPSSLTGTPFRRFLQERRNEHGRRFR